MRLCCSSCLSWFPNRWVSWQITFSVDSWKRLVSFSSGRGWDYTNTPFCQDIVVMALFRVLRLSSRRATKRRLSWVMPTPNYAILFILSKTDTCYILYISISKFSLPQLKFKTEVDGEVSTVLPRSFLSIV